MRQSKVKTCIAKVGKPDVINGMRTCGRPVHYLTAGTIDDGVPAQYSGWRHVYADSHDHLGVPASWL